jgi:hypothetical protein
MVGMIYERCHTRELAAYGGLAKILPVYSVFFMILTLAAIGLPTTSGFTGEFLVLLGAFNAAWPQHLAGDSVPLVWRWRSPAWCSARCTCCGSRSASCTARQGAARAGDGPEPAREAILATLVGAGVLARAVPAGADAQDRSRRAALSEAGRGRRPAAAHRARPGGAAARGGRAMNWSLMVVR